MKKTLLLAILIAIASSLDLQWYSIGFSSQLGLTSQQITAGKRCFDTTATIITNFQSTIQASPGLVDATITRDWVQDLKEAIMDMDGCELYEKNVKDYIVANTHASDIIGGPCARLSTYDTQIQQRLTALSSALTSGQSEEAGAIQANLYRIIFGLTNPAIDPTAVFTVSKNNRIVSFDGTTSSDPDGSIVSYSWDFGEPPSSTNTATTAAPTHIYRTGGLFLVRLTVTDNSGNSMTSTRSIDVSGMNILPTAAYTFTTRYLEVSFDASGNTDSDGSIASYAWNFGEPGSSSNTATSPTITTSYHVFLASGTYTVTLSITDIDGGISTITHAVSVVANVPPVVSFTYAVTGTDHVATFDASACTDTDGGIVDLAWDFGEAGSISNTASGTATAASHTYLAAGTYTVTLTVTDDYAATTTTTQTFIVNINPTAAFTSTISYLDVSFDATGSTDSDGSIAIYAWDFGESGSASNTASGSTPSHTYVADGTYTVTLTVTDDLGGTKTITHTVTVAANVPPTASFTYSATRLAVSFNGGGSTDSDGSVASWAWNFGESGSASNTASGSTTSHTYGSDGTYSVTLTVTDNMGLTHTTSQSISVVFNTPPVCGVGGNQAPTNAFDWSYTAAGSTDDGSIISYFWTFSDSSGATQSGPTATHVWPGSGAWTATVVLTDNQGATTSCPFPIGVWG